MFRHCFNTTVCCNLLLVAIAINLLSLLAADLHHTYASSGKPQRLTAIATPMRAGLTMKAQALAR